MTPSLKQRLKKHGFALSLIVASPVISHTAEAALVDRGGGLLYDTILDVTWLQDANYAKTSNFDADGKMDWASANSWVSNLSYYDSVRHVTYSDWRLPTIEDISPPGGNYAYTNADTGWNARTSTSELAYLYFVDLGLQSIYHADTRYYADYGIFRNATFNGVDRTTRGQNDVGPAINVQAFTYWSGSSYVYINYAWNFDFSKGYQTYLPKTDEYYVWAVRSGDVITPDNNPIVPIPGSAWLLASGLTAWIGLSRRKVNA